MTPRGEPTGHIATDAAPVVVYVINSFNRGGAEAGLLALVDGGLFANCRLKVVALVRGDGGLDAALAARGYPPAILVERVRMRSIDLPRLFVRLWWFLRKARPDAVIASLPQANLLARLCVAFQRRVTFISFEHNSHLAKKAYEIGFRLTSRRVDWMFADSLSTLESASQRLYRWRPNQRTVVPLVSFTAPAKRSYVVDSTKPFHIVNAGRFTAVKNQAALIEAVAILIGRNRNVLLTLYGDGPERARCEALAAQRGIESRVRFAGFVRDWAAQPADLFALASRHEGLCIVVLEAMHAGIPVAAPIVGGLRDYAGPEVAHILHSLDPRSIADTVANAMDQEAVSRRTVAAAGTMIDERFGADAVQSLYHAVNRALIRKTQQPALQGALFGDPQAQRNTN